MPNGYENKHFWLFHKLERLKFLLLDWTAKQITTGCAVDMFSVLPMVLNVVWQNHSKLCRHSFQLKCVGEGGTCTWCPPVPTPYDWYEHDGTFQHN